MCRHSLPTTPPPEKTRETATPLSKNTNTLQYLFRERAREQRSYAAMRPLPSRLRAADPKRVSFALAKRYAQMGGAHRRSPQTPPAPPPHLGSITLVKATQHVFLMATCCGTGSRSPFLPQVSRQQPNPLRYSQRSRGKNGAPALAGVTFCCCRQKTCRVFVPQVSRQQPNPLRYSQ